VIVNHELISLLLCCFASHSLWNSVFNPFRPIVFIGLHPTLSQAFQNRNRGFQATCSVSKGLIKAKALSCLLEQT
jgi:hypothetical protein